MIESLIDRAPLLPGISDEDLPAPISDEAIQQLPTYTAARLFELDEKRYRLAVALFFGEGLSFRGVCRVCRISCHTLQAIVRRESNGQTAEEWRKVASADIRASMYMIQRRIDELLLDDEAVKAAGLKGLATLEREHTHAHELLNQRLPGQGEGAKLTEEQQAELYIKSQQEARLQSIEVKESPEATRGTEAADLATDPADQGGE
jgi:hypothetical protein